ncbi:REP-associated tyrosine transposase [Methylotetracoccus oryzae]|uniref:REP-associated tyrosine transposase n=1 Tax=Methylotetracoccus oryzae TaxID=1919059 RepID=UPI001119BCEE|nr:transposase [Methylotetracoccus oryzae]
MKAVRHARDLRKGRHSESGRIYLVTAVTLHRQRVFDDLPAARILIRVLRREQELGRARTLSFVVMPDHLHWLLELGADADLSVVVRAVKALTAKRLGGTIWQRGFHDHAVRRDEDLLTIARYVVANPLRAGLVQRLTDYPHWDAIWL